MGGLLLGSLLLRPYVFGFVGLYLAVAIATWGWRRAVVFTGLAGGLAFVAEFTSTRIGVPFGLYHYTGITRGRELYLADVPLFDPLSFTFLAYASLGLARLLLTRRERAARGGLRGGITLAATTGVLMMWLDVVIDPLAVRGDRWFLGRIFYYPEPGVYFGVPLANFAGWALLGGAIAAAWLVVEPWIGGAPPVWAARLVGRPYHPVLLYYLVLVFNVSVTALVGESPLFWAGVASHLPLLLIVVFSLLSPVPAEDVGQPALIDTPVTKAGQARMSVPASQMWAVASYVVKQRLRGRKRYPLVLMLEPLFRCNLACAGCGKIQYPAQILKKHLSVEVALRAVEECGAPIVSIPGGEPLMYPEIGRLVEELVARRKYVYLCTNAILLKEKVIAGVFEPSKYLSFSVHLDGLREEHDEAVCRDGVYDEAVEGIREALRRGFRVTTNTTLFEGASPLRMRRFFDEMMDLGVEGMMLSPGYSYSKAPDQEHFLRRSRTHELFSRMLSDPKRRWRFNQSPLFLQFLMGKHDYECTPWGNPTFNVFGWQRPCYLLQEGYAESFQDLMENTRWERYGRKSGNEKCRDCMVHCGFEATAVDATFTTWKGFKDTVVTTVTGRL